MMVSVELLLNVALLIALAFLVATWIGRAKSNNSRGWWIAKVLDEAALAAIVDSSLLKWKKLRF